MDVEILARVQFAYTVAFHYLYPPLSIGLGLILVIMEGMYLRTRKKEYEQMTRFWIKIFALIFGLGVATGVVMEFEFGTNWATYSRYVGDIFGSALAAEGIFAFALEAGFLGILLFGWNRVPPAVHFISTVMVWLGSMFSAVWIVVANSWQQTPAGYRIVGEGLEARAEITDFWAMVFNPSSVDRLLHVWIGAFLAGAFLVMSVNAWYILKKRHETIAQPAFKIALVVATVFSCAQLLTGHRSAEIVAKYQPTKLAAFEGHFDSLAPADLYLFGWVDAKQQRTVGLAIPGGISFLSQGSFHAPIRGLKSFSPDNRPTQVNAIFQLYHLMVTIGLILIALSLLGVWMWYRGRLFQTRWLMHLFVWAVLLPQIANQAGWFAAEMGRQPWVVYGLLRTSEALSRNVTANQVLFSLILFFFVYTVLFLLFIYLLNRKIQQGPGVISHEENEPYSRRENPLMTPSS
ncbi:MAG: cytochrome ubiquinol oxidase subunit I [Saprospiraceae bacterium]|nr:cytochrome ubiquinol oxidase subunit I [Saprospiraceae bacterium]MDW8484040.1 cytochrome ubiquinol oxidase subunit I [Saprospiraceae bacterium]